MQQGIVDFSDIDIFIRNRPGEAERRNFQNVAPIYPFTTENLSGYLPLLNLSGKNILTISGSGDQVLSSIFYGAARIDAFDINILSNTFTELKMKALEYLSYGDYLRFFILEPDNKYILSKEIYSNFSEYLSAAARNIFDNLYTAFDGNGYNLRMSHVFFNQPPVDHNARYYNSYLQNERNYYLTRNKLVNIEYRWYQSNVTELVKVLQPSHVYDIILLSNIADYANRMYPGPGHLNDFFCNIVLPLKEHISADGIICAACIFKIDSVSPEHPENDLYNPDRRKQILSDLGVKYRELSFPGAIKGHNDGLLVIQ